MASRFRPSATPRLRPVATGPRIAVRARVLLDTALHHVFEMLFLFGSVPARRTNRRIRAEGGLAVWLVRTNLVRGGWIFPQCEPITQGE
eukprot:1173306-Prorocentrum_minimum.AAC.1